MWQARTSIRGRTEGDTGSVSGKEPDANRPLLSGTALPEGKEATGTKRKGKRRRRRARWREEEKWWIKEWRGEERKEAKDRVKPTPSLFPRRMLGL